MGAFEKLGGQQILEGAKRETATGEHPESNLDAWALGKISASEHRILMTQWIGTA